MDRARLYINNERIVDWTHNRVSSFESIHNVEPKFNAAGYPYNIGVKLNNTGYFDGYLSDVNFVD
ncbi:hypothetical protein HOG21_01195 [bacterium]|nr:hypothetical protein [bacterium]